MSDQNQRMRTSETSLSRRKLLEFLSASPILAPGAIGTVAGLLSGSSAALAQSYDVLRQAPVLDGDLIAAPNQALNVFDFELVAKKNLPPAITATLPAASMPTRP